MSGNGCFVIGIMVINIMINIYSWK